MPRSRILSFYIVLLLMLLADTLAKYLYFGNPLPLPYFVKRNNFYKGYLGLSDWNALEYLVDFLLDFGFLFFLFLLTAGKAEWGKFLPFAIPLLATLGFYFTVTQIMGYHSRFYLPSMPFFVIGTAYAMADLRTFRFSANGGKMAAGWVMFLLLLQFSGRPFGQYLNAKAKVESAAFSVAPDARDKPDCLGAAPADVVQNMTDFLRLLPEGSVVAATEYGLLSANLPQLNYLDLCGLHNPEIALRGYSDQMLSRWRPTLIWMPHPYYSHLRKQLLTGHWFREHYEYYPGAMISGIAVLKDSPQYDSLTRYLLKACRASKDGDRAEDSRR